MRALFLLLVCSVAVADGVTLQILPPSAVSWKTDPPISCVASGASSGVKMPEGSETVQPGTFTMTCTWPAHAQLSWCPPTTNTDGTPLTNLAGYKVYRRTGTGPEVLVTVINDPQVLTYRDQPLPTGNHFYMLTAYNTLGEESDRTPPVLKTIGNP